MTPTLARIRTPATTASRAWKRCRPLWFRLSTPARIAWIATALLLAPLRRRYRFDPAQLQVLILVRDLHTPLQGLVEACRRQGIPAGQIVLVDTGSTAPACLAALARLQQQGYQWLPLPADERAFGPYAPWLSAALRQRIAASRYPYLVSDADLAFPETMPETWLQELFSALNTHRFALKASLPLRISDITAPERARIASHEQGLIRHPAYRLLTALLLRRFPGRVACTTDTTLSLYRPARQFSTLSVRLPERFALRHLPWYSHFMQSDEFRYYASHKLPLFGEWSSLSSHG